MLAWWAFTDGRKAIREEPLFKVGFNLGIPINTFLPFAEKELGLKLSQIATVSTPVNDKPPIPVPDPDVGN